MKALVLLLAALPCALHAQVYKCTHGGKIIYSEVPCAAGTATVLDTPPAPPAADPQAELQRAKRESAALEKARHAREEREARADAQANRQAAKRRERCAKLRLERSWAQEDARGAAPQAEQAAQRKARRAGERYTAECQ